MDLPDPRIEPGSPAWKADSLPTELSGKPLWSNRCWPLLICGSSAFFKSSLNILKFLVHVLLKPSLENFEHYFAGMWDECSCVVIWTFLALPFFGIEMKTDLFLSCGYCWVFQICWHIKCGTLTASSFRKGHLESTHWKRSWGWKRLRAGGERGNRGWNGWISSPTQWTWIWANAGS